MLQRQKDYVDQRPDKSCTPSEFSSNIAEDFVVFIGDREVTFLQFFDERQKDCTASHKLRDNATLM
jgi:hypothetical protein